MSHKIAVFPMRHTVGLKQKFEYLHDKTLVSYIGMGFIYKLVAMLVFDGESFINDYICH